MAFQEPEPTYQHWPDGLLESQYLDMHIRIWYHNVGTNTKMNKDIFSEGGTGENQRINPHLNFGNFVENNNNIHRCFWCNARIHQKNQSLG